MSRTPLADKDDFLNPNPDTKFYCVVSSRFHVFILFPLEMPYRPPCTDATVYALSPCLPAKLVGGD